MGGNVIRVMARFGILLIGLGLIWRFDLDFFPWILVVLGATNLPGKIRSEPGWLSRLEEFGWVAGIIWLIGLTILLLTDTFWPGILLLIALTTIGGMLFRAPDFVKEKRDVIDYREKAKRDLRHDFFMQGDEDEDWNEAEPVSQRRSGHL